jgi:hypothetical protein
MLATRRSALGLFVFCLSFVINPGYFAGCTSGPGGPDFGEAEMLELLDEANATGPFDLEHDGTRYRLELTLEQRPGDDVEDLASRRWPAAFARPALACGHRTFLASAAACVTTSAIPLIARVTFVRLDATGESKLIDDREFAGDLSVSGDKLANAAVDLVDGDGDTRIELRSTDAVRFKLGQLRTNVDGFPVTFQDR